MADTDREIVTTDDVAAWLSNEAQGDDRAADVAFEHLCTAMPRVEPSQDFSQRAAAAAWRSRRRQHRWDLVGLVAVLTLAVSGAGGTWMAVLDVGPWLLASATAMVSGVLVGVVAMCVAGLDWWATGAQLGAAVGEALAYREIALVLLAVELLGAGALYALHQLARRARVNGAS